MVFIKNVLFVHPCALFSTPALITSQFSGKNDLYWRISNYFTTKICFESTESSTSFSGVRQLSREVVGLFGTICTQVSYHITRCDMILDITIWYDITITRIVSTGWPKSWCSFSWFQLLGSKGNLLVDFLSSSSCTKLDVQASFFRCTTLFFFFFFNVE